jgi:hypothetical protein
METQSQGGKIIEMKKGRARYTYKPVENISAVNLKQLSGNKPLEETQSTLEFFLVLICKHFKLKGKQAAAIIADGNKYLAHILVKGLKGLFQPIHDFYQEAYSKNKHLLNLIQNEEANGSVHSVMQIFKPGLLSKNYEVADWAARIIAKLGFEFANLDLLGTAWDWFTSKNGGLQTCILCLKRHPTMDENIVSIMNQYSRYSFEEMFTVQLKMLFPESKDYLHFVR